MSRILTVDDLVDQTRSQLDELNEATIDTTTDILPALNRAQDYAVDILARNYPEPFLAYKTLVLTGTEQEYDIPEDAFEDRLQKVEIQQNGQNLFYEVERISYRDISLYETTSKSNIPYYYVLYEKKMRFIPAPSGTYNARVWYMKEPEQLVLSQGRINIVNEASNYIVVDNVGSDLSTESDNLASYVNIVDGQSGRVKASLQIKRLLDNRIEFKSSPIRSTVQNRTIDTDLSNLTSELTIEPDDFICSIAGSCVPQYKKPFFNFAVQYASSELKRKLGDSSVNEETILQKFEAQVEHTWVKREQTQRVKKKSKTWSAPLYRWLNWKS